MGPATRPFATGTAAKTTPSAASVLRSLSVSSATALPNPRCTRPTGQRPSRVSVARSSIPTSPFSSTSGSCTPRLAASSGVARQVMARAVEGDERARPHELDHALLLLARRVAAHVDAGVDRAGRHEHAASQERGLERGDFRFVPRDDAAREDDVIADVEREGMLTAREASERRVGLGLRAGRDTQDAIAGQLRGLLRVHRESRGASGDSRCAPRRARALTPSARAARSIAPSPLRSHRGCAGDARSTRRARRRPDRAPPPRACGAPRERPLRSPTGPGRRCSSSPT